MLEVHLPRRTGRRERTNHCARQSHNRVLSEGVLRLCAAPTCSQCPCGNSRGAGSLHPCPQAGVSKEVWGSQRPSAHRRGIPLSDALVGISADSSAGSGPADDRRTKVLRRPNPKALLESQLPSGAHPSEQAPGGAVTPGGGPRALRAGSALRSRDDACKNVDGVCTGFLEKDMAPRSYPRTAINLNGDQLFQVEIFFASKKCRNPFKNCNNGSRLQAKA